MVNFLSLRETNKGQMVKHLHRVVQRMAKSGNKFSKTTLDEAKLVMQSMIINLTDSRSRHTNNGIAQNLLVRQTKKYADGTIAYQLGVNKAFLAANPGELEALEFGYTPHWVTPMTPTPKGNPARSKKENFIQWMNIHNIPLKTYIGKDGQLRSQSIFVNAMWSSGGLRPFEMTYHDLLGISKKNIKLFHKEILTEWRKK